MEQVDRRRPLTSCDQVTRLVWEYLDDELDRERRREVLRHLRVCPPCRAYVEFERAFLRSVARHAGTVKNTSTLLLRVLHALRTERSLTGTL